MISHQPPRFRCRAAGVEVTCHLFTKIAAQVRTRGKSCDRAARPTNRTAQNTNNLVRFMFPLLILEVSTGEIASRYPADCNG